MATEWVMVRVSRETHNDLKRVVQSLETAREQGKDPCELGRLGEVTLHEAIRVLIARDARKRQRARKARKTRKTPQ